MMRRFQHDRRGSTATEYAVIASLIAVTVLLMMPVGPALQGMFEQAAAGFERN